MTELRKAEREKNPGRGGAQVIDGTRLQTASVYREASHDALCAATYAIAPFATAIVTIAFTG